MAVMAQDKSTKRKFLIRECQGELNQGELEVVLARFPVQFSICRDSVPPARAYENQVEGTMEVYHSARVIDIFPPEGMRLSNAVVTDPEFPFRPDNIMDDQLGLRCCYHPQLLAFGIQRSPAWSEIEIDIHKFSKEQRFKKEY